MTVIKIPMMLNNDVDKIVNENRPRQTCFITTQLFLNYNNHFPKPHNKLILKHISDIPAY